MKKIFLTISVLVGFTPTLNADPLYCHEISVQDYCTNDANCHWTGDTCIWR